ncbi:UbiD family decarboxylase [Metarhizium rileyi]|uniref:UbiD family decarboxylase n=1 Tax=Metarhizium rileyi (strain RCEF 4871) TaxID=1649241 RepID=A0A166X9B5_METRR|nr:UbiD family decarboxylase [Metarhizium rileyi RCEF 4871]TWU71263.1 hypothetical protein ED733_002985 [Metarhizium rileyi]
MPDSRQLESWTWYGIAGLFTLCRFVSRSIRLGGVRYYELEDYVMFFAFGFYTNVIVWVNIQEKHPHTNILPPSGTDDMAEGEILDRAYGSTITFVIEESMVVLQMLCKVCMCLLFMTLTSGLKRQLQVKLLLGYILVGWVITEVFFFGFWCRPFRNYFQVFAGNTPGCTTSQNHLIMSFTFNLSSDLLMLAVPIPMLLQSQLPWKQKATICGIFGLGIFVIIAAVLNRYYCFAHPESILWIYWYVREASTAIVVTNVPHCYALRRKVFRLDAFSSLVSSIRKTKRSRVGKYGVDVSSANKDKGAGDRAVRRKKPGSERTENFASNIPKPESTLRIWQRSEYSVNMNDANGVPTEEMELQQIWQGGLGTTAKVEVDKTASDAGRVAHGVSQGVREGSGLKA